MNFRRNALQGILITDLSHLNGRDVYEFKIHVGKIFSGKDDLEFVGKVVGEYLREDGYKEVGGFFRNGGRKIFERGNRFVYADVNLLKESLRVSLRQINFENVNGKERST